MTHKVYLVDVFARQAFTGNPLPVVVCEGSLSDESMQKIAAEMDYSETTFVTSVSEVDGKGSVRVFTPSREIEFTGHPVLGTAWVIRHYVFQQPVEQIHLELMVGRVTVSFEYDKDGGELAWFSAPEMEQGAIADPVLIAAALGLSGDDIHTDFPVQMISAGTSAVIVPLRSLDALKRCRLDLQTYTVLSEQGFPPLVYVFCQQTLEQDNDLSARFFFDAHGIREDPATGNGAAFLGSYLLEYPIVGEGDISLRIEQGHEVRRPSLVLLRASGHAGSRKVSVGGEVFPVLQGELLAG
jgi:trans-2,3-dihydro-3-hydroxyanthranilate isomerase